ncbi:hypothetical protein [Brucella intermedia]|uniref:hypothetical protein n=1 Tax=Brucella intermedia TaxID=94625 RepID=UPI0012D3520D|nr:hypothetical protein [Brucella intermedia]
MLSNTTCAPARRGEQISDRVLGHDIRVASLVTDHGIVVVDRAGLSERLPDDNTGNHIHGSF